MKKVVIGLSAILFAVTSARSATNGFAAEAAPNSDPDCNYVCIYAASVNGPREADSQHSAGTQLERELAAVDRRAASDQGAEVSTSLGHR
jgi:hypothetical protein